MKNQYDIPMSQKTMKTTCTQSTENTRETWIISVIMLCSCYSVFFVITKDRFVWVSLKTQRDVRACKYKHTHAAIYTLRKTSSMERLYKHTQWQMNQTNNSLWLMKIVQMHQTISLHCQMTSNEVIWYG